VDEFGRVIDVFVSQRRDVNAASRFFDRAINTTRTRPVEVVTDRAATYPIVLEELFPAAWHRTELTFWESRCRPTQARFPGNERRKVCGMCIAEPARAGRAWSLVT
jgi:transposase-like protein